MVGGGGVLYARLQFTSCVTTIPAFVVSVVQFVCNLILFQLDLHVKLKRSQLHPQVHLKANGLLGKQRHASLKLLTTQFKFGAIFMLKVQGYFFLGIVLTPYLLQSWR